MKNQTEQDPRSVLEEKRSEISRLLKDRLADSIDLMLRATQACQNAEKGNMENLRDLLSKVASDAGVYGKLIARHIAPPVGKSSGEGRSSTSSSWPDSDVSDLGGSHEDASDLVYAIARYGDLANRAGVRCAELGNAEAAEIFARISHSVARNLFFTSRRASLSDWKRNTSSQPGFIECDIHYLSERKPDGNRLAWAG